MLRELPLFHADAGACWSSRAAMPPLFAAVTFLRHSRPVFIIIFAIASAYHARMFIRSIYVDGSFCQ